MARDAARCFDHFEVGEAVTVAEVVFAATEAGYPVQRQDMCLGQVNDMQGAVAISREQLDQELFGGLPDPAIERVNRDRQQTNR